ncbi:MAG TPA: hypothetical protein VK469_22670 [Candidatus Kapabacteria bacterium]|nr:hypothetical protein [Candidatus Kapabacteria bacterium]
MKHKKIGFIIFFLFFTCSLVLPGKSQIVLNSIDYPRTIAIRNDFYPKIEDYVEISFNYYGKEIVSNYGRPGNYNFDFFYEIGGKILYYDSSSVMLPLDDRNSNTKKAIINIGLDGGLSGNYGGVLFSNEGIYSFKIPVFSPFPDFETSDVGQFIKKKAISYIVICIGKVILKWQETESDTKSKKYGQPFRGGRLILDVNRTIKIDIKYDDSVDIKKE